MALSVRVTTTAMSIPVAPNWLPLTAVRGRLSRLRPQYEQNRRDEVAEGGPVVHHKPPSVVPASPPDL